MFKGNRKKRQSIKKLSEAAKVTNDMLIKKNIIAKSNVLADISKMPNGPKLPGIPRYLPHKWTITAARRIMFDLLNEWADITKENETKQDNAGQFFEFVVKRMAEQERIYRLEMRKMKRSFESLEESPVIYDVFSPVRKYETTKALHKFFIDSFAISVIEKANGSVIEYAEWFLGEWTEELYKIWEKKEIKDGPR